MNSTYIQEVLLKINSADSEQTVKRLEQTIKDCAAAKDNLIKAKPDQKDWTEQEWKNWQKWNREMASAERQLKRYGTTSTNVKATLDNLSGKSLKDLNAALKTMQKALDGGQIARGSKAWNELTDGIRKTKEEIERVKGETKLVEQAMVDCAEKPANAIANFSSKWGGLAAVITAGLNIYDRFMGKASEYVNKYAELQEHVSGVIKYTGMGAEAAADLNEEFKKMDTRTSRAALNDLAADAGRLGITGKKDVLDFVQAADQINVALGEDLGEGAIKNIGKLATLFGDDKKMGLKQAMLSTASAVNDLAQSSSASEGYIVEFTGRLAGAAAQAGMTQAQVMGLASVFDQAMINAEESSTALSKILIKMYKDPAAMARAAGLDVKSFTETLRNDANAALIEFAKGVQNMGGLESVAPMLADLSLQGAGVSKMLLTLANDTQKVADTQAQAAAAFAEGTSVTNEFNAANSTAQAQLEKARNALNGVYAEIGEKLYPVFLSSTNAMVAFMQAVSSVVGFIVKYKTQVAALATVVALLALKQKALTLAIAGSTRAAAAQRMGLATWRILMIGLTAGVKGATAAVRTFTAAIAANPFGAILVAITTAISLLDIFKTKAEENAEAQREREEADLNLANAEKKVAEETSQQIARVKRLSEMILDNTRAQKNRLWAINELRKIIPDYNGKLGDEKKLTEDTTTAVNNYIDALKRMARQKVISNMVGELDSQIIVNELSRDRRQTGLTNVKNRFNRLLQQDGMEQYYNDIMAGKSKGEAWRNLHTAIYGDKEATVETTQYISGLITQFNELVSKSKEYRGLLEESNNTLRKLYQKREMLIKGAERMGITREEIEQQSAGVTPSTGGGRRGGYTPAKTGSTSGADKERQERKEAFDKIEQEYRDAAKRATAAYAEGLENGTMTEEAYYREMIAAAEDYKKKSVAVAGATAEEKKKAEEDYTKKVEQINDDHRKNLLAREDANYNAQITNLKFLLETQQITESEYQQRSADLLIMHQTNRLNIVKQYKTKEQQVVDELESQQAENAKQAASGLEKLKQLLIDIRVEEEKRKQGAKNYKDLLEDLNKEEKDAIATAKKEASQLQSMGLDAADVITKIKKHFAELREELKEKFEAKIEIKALSSEIDFGFSGLAAAFQKIVKRRKKERENDAKDASKTAYKQEKDEEKAESRRLRRRKKNRDKDTADEKKEDKKQKKNKEKTEEEKWDAAIGLASAANETIQSIGSATSSLFQANCAIETAKIEQEYAARIAAAEGNAELQQQLEEEKNAKIAAVKAKYAEKEFRLNIAMAVAQTATNALTAFGTMAKHEPYPALAIAAAALATATGLVQVATIKKQYEAQKAAGFFTGGYTGGSDYKKPAGIVHEGEYVLPHEAVNNPAVSPFLDIIETARRSNRIASLTPEDVSRAVTAPQAAAAMAGRTAAAALSTAAAAARTANNTTAPVVTIKGGDQTAAAVRRLNRKLDEGIESYVVLSGPQGLDSQWRRYQRLTGK